MIKVNHTIHPTATATRIILTRVTPYNGTIIQALGSPVTTLNPTLLIIPAFIMFTLDQTATGILLP